MNYSELYQVLLKCHSTIPRGVGGGWAFPPLRVLLLVTFRCNLDCKMCFQTISRREKRELEFKEIVDVIKQIPMKSLITVTGGEPFIRKDILDIIEYSTRRNFCNIITNGTLLRDEVASALVKFGVTLVGVSIDGIERTHDEIRGRRGAFEKAVVGIKRVQEWKNKSKAKFPLIDIKTVITRDNVAGLSSVLDLAEELRADFFTLSVQFDGDSLIFHPKMRNYLSGKFMRPTPIQEPLNLDILQEELQVIQRKKSRVGIRFYPFAPPSEIVKYYSNGGINSKDYHPCHLPWSQLCVSPLGEVFPCLSYQVGDIRRERLSSIWNGKHYRFFRNELKKAKLFPACLGCCYLEYKGQSSNHMKK